MQVLACPNCGAPLPPHAYKTVVTCGHCKASVSLGIPLVHAARFRDALKTIDREIQPKPSDIEIGGRRFAIDRLIAHGTHCDVFLARRARRITERVIVKVDRAPNEADRIAHEYDVLSTLAASHAQGADHFTRRLPSLVTRGTARAHPFEGHAAIVVRAMRDFMPTLEDVRAEYAKGIDARHGVWLWRRLLELLGWVHRSGIAHAAIVPSHVVINAASHGAMLVSWSAATRIGVVANEKSDLAMAARCVLYALGSDDETPPASVPAILRDLLESSARAPNESDAWRMNDIVGQAAERVFGPPTFVPFLMPIRDRIEPKPV